MYRFSSLYLLILIVAPCLIVAQEADGQDSDQKVHYVSHRSAKIPWKNPPGSPEKGDWVFFRTEDNGQNWIPVAAIYPNADGMAPLPRFEKDGHYGYRFVKLKGAKLQGALTPVPGTPPEIKIIVDTKAPICRWTLPQKSLLRGPPILLEWEAKDDNLSEDCVRIDYRREGTYEWKRVADRISNSGSYRWKNPPRGLGQVRFRLTIRDRGGLVATMRSRTYEVTPVRLTIRMGPGARTHHKPGLIPIPYILDNYAGMSIAGASLWVTSDEGKSWGMADERMETRGIFEMRLQKEGTYGLWMEAREPGAPKSPGPSSGQLPTASIVVDGTPPAVVFQCAPGPETRFKPGQTLTLTWSAKDKHLRSNEMRIEASKDGGKTWEVVHQSLASRGTNQVSIPDVDDESFLLKASVTDQAGNRTDQFLPEKRGFFQIGSSTSVTPETPTPEVPTPEVPQPDIATPLEQPKGFTAHLFNFNGSSQQPEIYKGGKTEVVRWYLPSKTTQAKLEVNYGDGTYQTLKEGIRSNQYVWVLPRITQSNCRLRLTIEDEEHPSEMTSSRKTFSIDSLPPRCTKINGMKWLGSRSAQLNMTAFIEDQGDAGVEELRLWSRRDSKTEWILKKHSKVDRATWAGRWRLFNSKPTDGRWHFFVTSTDRKGNESPPPQARQHASIHRHHRLQGTRSRIQLDTDCRGVSLPVDRQGPSSRPSCDRIF